MNRKTKILLYAEAVVRGFVKDYAENPKWFPKPDTLPLIAARFSENIGMAGISKPTKKERQEAHDHAKKQFELIIAFAETWNKEKIIK